MISKHFLPAAFAICVAADRYTTTSTDTPTSTSTCLTESHTATFDDITAVPAVEQPAPTPYMSLDFQAFDILAVIETNAAPGVLPQSGLQYAVSNALIETAEGTPEWTVLYPNSNVTSFSLQSFYYGCSIDLENGVVAAPTSCNVAFTGFQVGDNDDEKVQVAAQEFAYEPTSSTAPQQMALGVFNEEFKNIQFVQIQYTLPGGSAALQSDLVFLVDTIKYTTCSK